MAILQAQQQSATDALAAGGDRPIAGGQWSHAAGEPGSEASLRVRNANNHQVTYGVLAAALQAVGDYLQNLNFEGMGSAAVGFLIFDGANQVGVGSLEFG